MKFTFFKTKGLFSNIQEFNALSRTELAKLQNFSLFFQGVGGHLGVIWTSGFFRKKQMELFISISEIVHQKGLLGRIK